MSAVYQHYTAPQRTGGESLASKFARLPEDERNAAVAGMSDEAVAALRYDWRFWARPEQLAPGSPGAALDREDWFIWLALAGRGFGKTRMGAEWVRQQKNTVGRIAIIAPTAADVRDVMIKGESGILETSPPDDRPIYRTSNNSVTWNNGAVALLYSAEQPERLRGANTGAAWCDELCSWQYDDAFTQLRFGMRGGKKPRIVITTTPKPTDLLRKLIVEPGVVVTRGNTYANMDNLPASYIADITGAYGGTRLGRQEIEADILFDTPGALWKAEDIERARVKVRPDLKRIVVAVDPAMSTTEKSDETGIIVVGLGEDSRVYVLADLSGRYSPEQWASRAVGAYAHWKADAVVAEKNQGGDLVSSNLRQVASHLPVKLVHASRGKWIRAEPVATLYEQGMVSHVGLFNELEDQMTSFTIDNNRKKKSPDRLDAMVWGVTYLVVDKQHRPARTGYFPIMGR